MIHVLKKLIDKRPCLACGNILVIPGSICACSYGENRLRLKSKTNPKQSATPFASWFANNTTNKEVKNEHDQVMEGCCFGL